MDANLKAIIESNLEGEADNFNIQQLLECYSSLGPRKLISIIKTFMAAEKRYIEQKRAEAERSILDIKIGQVEANILDDEWQFRRI